MGQKQAPMPYRSKTEARYAALLTTWQQAGLIVRWCYEPIRLRLAPQTTLTPDFLIQWPSANDTRLTFDEVKGWKREDAMVKLKVAAALYPMFRFRCVQWRQGDWRYDDIPNH
jgi:hypothetical protein